MSKFYGVAHGFKRGVFTEWAEAKKQIDKFPQPVYKKFETEEEAQKYVDDRKPKKVECELPFSYFHIYKINFAFNKTFHLQQPFLNQLTTPTML